MQNHIDQANHNQDFHDCIDTNFPDKFYDWKITVCFYIGLHWLKSLAAMKGIDIGETHFDIDKNVNPSRPHPIMPISRNAWREYKALFNYSQTARYTGITDLTTFEQIKKIDHSNCLIHLYSFKKHIKGFGIPL